MTKGRLIVISSIPTVIPSKVEGSRSLHALRLVEMTISGRDDKEKPQRASQRAEVVETKQENQKNEGDFSTLLEMTPPPVIPSVVEGSLRALRLVGMTIREVLEVVPILLAGEAGAGFVDAFEFTVAHDLGIRIVDLQGAEECN